MYEKQFPITDPETGELMATLVMGCPGEPPTAAAERRYEIWEKLGDPKYCNPIAAEALLQLALELPPEEQDRLRAYGLHFRLDELVPNMTPEVVALVERLYMAPYFGHRRDGADVLANQAAWLCGPEGAARCHEAPGAVAAVERLLLEPSEDPGLSEWPSASIVSDGLRRLTPAFSLRLVAALVRATSVPATAGWWPASAAYRHVASAAQLLDAEVEELLSWRDSSVDAALAQNRSLGDEAGWRLYVRYAENPNQLPDVAHHGSDLVAFYVRTGNAAALRGVARRLFRVAEEQRADVATIALQALLKNPGDSDGAAAYHICRTLGPKAGLALLRTGNDEIARGVARAWRWTLDDGIFDALRSHPREYVRRKMVPRGTEDEPYRFTDEEVHRLKSAVIPVVLRDRAKLVRERAQDLLDALHSDSSETDSPTS